MKLSPELFSQSVINNTVENLNGYFSFNGKDAMFLGGAALAIFGISSGIRACWDNFTASDEDKAARMAAKARRRAYYDAAPIDPYRYNPPTAPEIAQSDADYQVILDLYYTDESCRSNSIGDTEPGNN